MARNRIITKAKKAGLTDVDLLRVRMAAKKEAEKVEDKATDRAFLYMLAIPLNVLVDQWGDEAKEKAPEFINEVIGLYEAVQDGIVHDDQLAELLDEMAGVKISDKLLGRKKEA